MRQLARSDSINIYAGCWLVVSTDPNRKIDLGFILQVFLGQWICCVSVWFVMYEFCLQHCLLEH